MSGREKLLTAVKFIAWGYIFIHLDINLGTLNILPNWVGYILLMKALPALSEEETSAALLRPLGTALAVWNFISWLVKLFGITYGSLAVQNIMSVIGYVMIIIGMYFHFQLLTNLANAAERYNCSQKDRILRLRAVNTVLMLVLNLPLPWDKIEAAAIILLFVMAAVTLWICAVLFSLKKELDYGNLD